MTSRNNETEWRVPVAVETIPPTGLHVEIDAPDEVRAQIVKLAGLRDLPRLSAAFDLTRRGAGVHVSGTVRAVVGQTCVVTLDPMETALEEPVDLLFTPQAAAVRGNDEEPVIRRELGENDPPEALINGEVDIGKIATEFLILGIDPYPRKPDAQFAPPSDDTGRDNPFAALAALKKPPGGDKP